MLKLRYIGDPVLRKKSREVKAVSGEIARFLDAMLETMYASKGVGLAAPQVGVDKRLIVVDVGTGPLQFVNPCITWKQGCECCEEGCLSVPDEVVAVTRASSVVVEALDKSGKKKEYHMEGLLARAVQHEIDHLDGVLIVDYLKRKRGRKTE